VTDRGTLKRPLVRRPLSQVTIGADFDEWRNSTAVGEWVTRTVNQVTQLFADGINIDIEQEVTNASDAAALSEFTRRAVEGMRAANPHSQVSDRLTD
jgi:hypothetical protein